MGSDDDDYGLPRDSQESQRLTAQHYAMIARQGYILHPMVTETINQISKPVIADIATGNGIWAFELGKSLPNATVLGLDLADTQFPPRWTWLDNVELQTLDILQEVPSEMRGKFDVVHVRLLLSCGPQMDKEVYINTLKSFLKPGGWLQLDELAYPNAFMAKVGKCDSYIARADLEPCTEMEQLGKYAKFPEKLGFLDDWENVLKNIGGFQEAKASFVPILPHLIPVENNAIIAVVSSIVSTFIEKQVVTSAEDVSHLKDLVRSMTRKSQEGKLMVYNWNIYIGRLEGVHTI